MLELCFGIMWVILFIDQTFNVLSAIMITMVTFKVTNGEELHAMEHLRFYAMTYLRFYGTTCITLVN